MGRRGVRVIGEGGQQEQRRVMLIWPQRPDKIDPSVGFVQSSSVL